jgi:acyl carrier protein|tara:strand:- start:209 stop:451 length:243 start_codon:yes stop_codon:yes gene_type:complete
MNNCKSIVIEIIEKSLELKSGILTEDSDSENTEEWDSLGQLSILVELDKYFEGKISNIPEMAEANSVSKIIIILKENSIC